MFPARVYVGQIIAVFAIVLAAIWGATQWTAAALGYQAALGAAWFKIAGFPVYRPWWLFEWWYVYDAYAPHVFEQAGAIAASGGVAGALFAVVNSVWRARQNTFVTTYGSARWATRKEIASAGLFKPKGVFLSRVGGAYLRHDGPEHVMCFAPTRSGKGVGLVLPTLLSWTSSEVVHDIKGENWRLTAGWRSKFSHSLLFDPTNPCSARYNPLLEVRKGSSEVRDVQNIADILVDPEGALERRNHWEKTSHALLVGVILHVLYAEERKTLARVTELLADPAQSFEKTLRIMMATNHLGSHERPQVHPVVAATARELLNKSENERSGVLSTAVSFLSLYRDPTIARNTEACDWRIADLVATDKPVTFYLVVPPSDLSRTKPLIRLVLNQIGRRLTETLDGVAGGGKKRPLLIMLDEFPALGRLDFFESALAFLAGYGVRVYLILRLGIMSTISPDEIVDLIASLRERHPGVDLKLCDANARELRGKLLAGDLDVVIYALPGEEPDDSIHKIPLFREQMVIVVHRGHQLANARAFPVKELNGECYIHSMNCEFAGYADNILREQHVTCTPAYWSERDDWTLAMVAAGLGFAFMPANAAKHANVVAPPVVGPEFWRVVNLVSVRGRPHSAGVGSLVREAMRKKWFGRRPLAAVKVA